MSVTVPIVAVLGYLLPFAAMALVLRGRALVPRPVRVASRRGMHR